MAIDTAPIALAAAGGYVWVPGQRNGILTRIDPATNATTEIQLVPGIFVAEPVGDRVWVTDFSGSDIYFVDPALVE